MSVSKQNGVLENAQEIILPSFENVPSADFDDFSGLSTTLSASFA